MKVSFEHCNEAIDTAIYQLQRGLEHFKSRKRQARERLPTLAPQFPKKKDSIKGAQQNFASLKARAHLLESIPPPQAPITSVPKAAPARPALAQKAPAGLSTGAPERAAAGFGQLVSDTISELEPVQQTGAGAKPSADSLQHSGSAITDGGNSVSSYSSRSDHSLSQPSEGEEAQPFVVATSPAVEPTPPTALAPSVSAPALGQAEHETLQLVKEGREVIDQYPGKDIPHSQQTETVIAIQRRLEGLLPQLEGDSKPFWAATAIIGQLQRKRASLNRAHSRALKKATVVTPDQQSYIQ